MSRRRVRDVALDIVGVDASAMGCGEIDGRTVRVRNALRGEHVTARVLKRRRGEWFADAISVARPAASRVPAPCAAFPRCGGCALQHVDPVAQRAHKEAVLLAELDAVGVTPYRLRPPVAVDLLHYRRKARLGVRCLGDEVLVGFRESYSSRVARLHDCKTLVLPAARLLAPLRQLLSGMAAKAHIPQVEVIAGDSQLALLLRHLSELSPADAAALKAFAIRHRVWLYLQPGGYDELVALEGPPPQVARLGYVIPAFGIALEFALTDFVQANASVNAALVSDAVAALAPAPEAKVADLFCGIGNFSLPLVRRGARVLGLEMAPGAVARARHNAQRNGVGQWCEFQTADLYDPAHGVHWDAQLLLLDPPRTGAGPNLGRWLSAPSLERVVYVSCNPQSFAEDARQFARDGFALRDVGIYDMFPQTAHVETLGVFARG